MHPRKQILITDILQKWFLVSFASSFTLNDSSKCIAVASSDKVDIYKPVLIIDRVIFFPVKYLFLGVGACLTACQNSMVSSQAT